MPNVELFMTLFITNKGGAGGGARANFFLFFMFYFFWSVRLDPKIGTVQFILVCVPLMKLH